VVLVIVARADLDTLLRLQLNWGDLIILFNMALLAVYAAIYGCGHQSIGSASCFCSE
jgi:hypothetical protein